ncbi:hypothetical protein FBU30_010903 [Linnemannia zychae]|nr:hypothetical protein FBU30_010903 [Linnemannia zychae]
MSLFHNTPVTVQRTYYKPSVMSRLRALISPHRAHRRTVAPGTRRPIRQPVRKSGVVGLFRTRRRRRRVPRRAVVATPRRRSLFSSLRPRRYYDRTARPVGAAGYRHHHGNGKTFSAILAALSLKKHRNRHRRAYGIGYGPNYARPRY